MWEEMVDCTRMRAKEILGISRRGGCQMKGTWGLFFSWVNRVGKRVK